MSNISPEQSSLGLYIFIIYPKQGCIKIPPPPILGEQEIKDTRGGKGEKEGNGKKESETGKGKDKRKG